MTKIKNSKKDFSSIYTPLLAVTLLVAIFFVGRLSSQVEMMKKGSSLPTANNEVPAQVGDISVSGLKAMAKDIGLNKKDFASCLDEGKFEKRVKDDMVYGGTLGVSGTPAFFVNDVMIVGAQPQIRFETVIDYELAGGDWDNPTEAVSALVDGDPSNGEVTLVAGVKQGVGYVKGGSDAVVKIVEFSDFECPFCKRTLPTIEALFNKYGDKISLEYRHFPLSIHAKAQKAAEASECAGEQGKFWEMHDMIFEVQG